MKSAAHLLRPIVLLLLGVAVALGAPDAPPKTNVLFIVSDDLRAELATYGSPAHTPNIERLAKRGLQFDRAYTQQARCNASRSSFLTGLRPDTLRIWNNGTHFRELNPDVMTLPLWFKEHGYETRCVGKIFHNWHTKEHGDRALVERAGVSLLRQSRRRPAAGDGRTAAESRDAEHARVRQHHDVRMPRRAGRSLLRRARRGRGRARARRGEGPAFLPRRRFLETACARSMRPRSTGTSTTATNLPPLDPRRPAGAPDIAFHDSREILGPPDKQQPLTPGADRRDAPRLFRQHRYMDAQLGKVLDALDRSGVADRTIIVFVADHGYHIGEHTLWGKTSNFELDARVPFFISAPGMESAGPADEFAGGVARSVSDAGGFVRPAEARSASRA